MGLALWSTQGKWPREEIETTQLDQAAPQCSYSSNTKPLHHKTLVHSNPQPTRNTILLQEYMTRTLDSRLLTFVNVGAFFLITDHDLFQQQVSMMYCGVDITDFAINIRIIGRSSIFVHKT
jgi:hypothetical protein